MVLKTSIITIFDISSDEQLIFKIVRVIGAVLIEVYSTTLT